MAIVNKAKVNFNNLNSYNCCINIEIPRTIRIENIVGKAVEEYIPYMKSIVNFALRALKVHIKYIVADFVKDSKGQIWFIDLKNFRIPKNNKLIRYSITPKRGKRIYSNTNPQLKCSLCDIEYPKNKLKHLITTNMIIKYKKHLMKRGVFEFEHINAILIILIEVQKIRGKLYCM